MAGIVQGHDTTHSPVGLWQLAGNLNDTSGNSFTLTVETGTSRFVPIFPTLKGFYFDGSTALWHNVSAATLRITGDMTFECLFMLEAVTAAAYWFSHTAGGETSDTNQQYGLQFNLTTFPAIAWIQESGAGVNSSYGGANNYMPLGRICHMAVTRTANVIQPYLNSRAWGSPSATLTTPDGGATGRLRLGGDSVTRIRGVMASAKLIASALTANQIKAEYNRTLGDFYGLL